MGRLGIPDHSARSPPESLKARPLLLFLFLLALLALVSIHRTASCKCCGTPASANSHGEPAGDDASPPIAWRTRHPLAIAFLTRRRDSLANLEQSLQLVHSNVLPSNPADVLVFHEGDFSPVDQANLRAGRPDLHFLRIPPQYWNLPTFLNMSDASSWHDTSFSLGYRHMIRWFSLHIWSFAAEAGYEWVMRLDEESFIWSPVRYSLVDFAVQRDVQYAYRSAFIEWPTSGLGFPEMLAAYLAMYPQPAEQLLKQCTPPNLAGLTGSGWSRFAFYNNFFLTRVSFWQRRDVRRFLEHIDRTGGIYTHRWGDALVHTVAVQIFLNESQVHKFEDWTYEHATLSADGWVTWGGILAGTADPDAQQHLRKFAAAHHGTTMHCIEESVCG